MLSAVCVCKAIEKKNKERTGQGREENKENK